MAALTAFTVPASAEPRTVTVRLADGQVVTITVDVPPGTPLNDIELGPVLPPGTPVTPAPQPEPPTAAPAPAPDPTGDGTPDAQPDDGSDAPGRARGKDSDDVIELDPKAPVEPKELFTGDEDPNAPRRARSGTSLRLANGAPASTNPGFMDVLPGPSFATGVPNFVIRKFRVPPFLLPIYQAAGIEYGVRWEVLAAINEIETDYGRNLNVSSAGALGWMQFIPSSWRMYGVDANKDGKKDPYNPVDAIFAAARYLKAAGYESDVRRAVFAYNHADWYVDSVMLRARLIAGVPADLVGSLTGLTEGRFPVAARARYADDLQEAEQLKRVRAGQNAANIVEDNTARRAIEIYSDKGAPVVATNDGQIKQIGQNEALGRYITLQDVYGNRYTYSGLGKLATFYPVPKQDASDPDATAKALSANDDAADPKPAGPASAGRQPDSEDGAPPAADESAGKAGKAGKDKGESGQAVDDSKPQASVPIKERLFANPSVPGAREAGGLEQTIESKARRKGGYATYRNFFSRPFGGDTEDVRLRRLKVGAKVIGGTVLGKVGRPSSVKAAHVVFAIRPAGAGAPRIDPKPILDGWKLLEATAVYRASGRNVLYGGEESEGLSIGQILLLPKPLLERRVLSDERIEVYPCGQDDIRSGQIDRRVLATLSYLAESGLRPSVTSLKCGHGVFTSSGNVSHHSSGNAVDIAKVNGVPILGHQEPGGVTDQTVRRLMRLQGTLQPDQVISLLELGGVTYAMGDHADHIHVGFRPLFGSNRKLGKQALAVLKPGQWSDLLDQLRTIENPVVPTEASKYAIPSDEKRASKAHEGE